MWGRGLTGRRALVSRSAVGRRRGGGLGEEHVQEELPVIGQRADLAPDAAWKRVTRGGGVARVTRHLCVNKRTPIRTFFFFLQ